MSGVRFQVSENKRFQVSGVRCQSPGSTFKQRLDNRRQMTDENRTVGQPSAAARNQQPVASLRRAQSSRGLTPET